MYCVIHEQKLILFYQPIVGFAIVVAVDELEKLEVTESDPTFNFVQH